VIRREQAAPAAATIVLHVVAVTALLQFDALQRPLLESVPIMVSLLAPSPQAPPVEPPRPRPAAPKAEPRAVRAPKPPPLIASDAPAAGASFVAPIAPPAAPAPAAPAAAPAPRVVPPSFDAAYLRNPAPAYPSISRRRGEQGTVVLRVYVGADGIAQKVLVNVSSGHERLDSAAQEAVQQWRFVPARQGEAAVAAWVLVPIRFALEG